VPHQSQEVPDVHLIAAIVEYSDDAIIGSTLSGVITTWNPAAVKMYGYPSQEIIGRSGSLLVPQDRAGEFLDTVLKVKNGKAVERFETTRVRKDGSVVPVSLTVAPIRDQNGVIIGASAVHRDVTEQRRAFEVAQRMEAIVESSDDAIIAITLEGKVTSWNPAAEKLFGYTSEEIIGKSAEILRPTDQLDEIKAILTRNRASQRVEHLHTVGVRKDDTVFPVSLTVSPIRSANGTIVGTIVNAIEPDNRSGYYYSYYGILEDAEIQRLKQLSALALWAGSVVHETIEDFLRTNDSIPECQVIRALPRPRNRIVVGAHRLPQWIDFKSANVVR